MKKYVIYLVAVFFFMSVACFAAPTNDELMAKENAAWQAFKDKKPDAFKKVVSADFLGVYAEGISDMAKEVSDMQKWDMKSFAISDYKVVPVGTDTMMASYTVKIVGTYDRKDSSGTYNAGSVWKMQNGAWMAIFHTNAQRRE